MGKIFVIELGKSRTIIDGLANHEHGGEGEVVVVDDFGEVFQLAAIDALVGPGEMIAGRNGGVLGIFLQQFALHVVDDGSRKEDAHGALATGQQVQLFFLGHGSATLATRQDDGLGALGNGKLRAQFGSCSEERRDAWRDVIRHVVGVEEGHLFLNGAKDARVASMQADNEVAAVVVLLHQGALLFKVHVGRAADNGTRLVAFGQRLWNERASI